MKTIESKGSRVWIIRSHPLYKPKDLRINWSDLLPPQSDETKHERAYLRGSVKGYFYAAISNTESRIGVLSPGTVQAKFLRIRVLCRWMLGKGIWRFSALSVPDIQEFMQERLQAVARGRTHAEAVTRSSVNEYFEIMEELWHLRDLYVAPLRINVAQAIDIQVLLAQTVPSQMWRPVELHAAKGLLKWAISEIEGAGEIADALDEIWFARSRWVGLTRFARKRESFILIRRVDQNFNAARFARMEVQSDGLLRAIRNLTGAILLIILFFTGMRISEVLTLEIDCLEERLHEDGVSYSYLKGPGAKKKGRERLWVVPEIVVEVVRLQIRLFERIRLLHKVPMLFTSKFDTMRILTGRFKPRELSGSVANYLMRSVIGGFLGENHELSTSFHAHRARKTFARFVVMRDKSSLESMAHHYGHVYAAVLDRHYVGNDFRLDEMIRDEDLNELRSELTRLLTASSIGGKAGDRIMAVRDKAGLTPDFRGKLALDSLVEKLVKNGLILAPCDWGYCVYAHELSKCKGSVNGPNPVQRAPSTCGSCSNFAVTERHLPWWERRHSEQTKFLKKEGLPDQTRRVVSAQLEMTEQVLTSIVRRRRENGVA